MVANILAVLSLLVSLNLFGVQSGKEILGESTSIEAMVFTVRTDNAGTDKKIVEILFSGLLAQEMFERYTLVSAIARCEYNQNIEYVKQGAMMCFRTGELDSTLPGKPPLFYYQCSHKISRLSENQSSLDLPEACIPPIPSVIGVSGGATKYFEIDLLVDLNKYNETEWNENSVAMISMDLQQCLDPLDFLAAQTSLCSMFKKEVEKIVKD